MAALKDIAALLAANTSTISLMDIYSTYMVDYCCRGNPEDY
jgi:hypothetical protein